jgi:hypothetical protein
MKFLGKLIALLCVFSVAGAYELTVCAIFQNEGPYFKEWIDYHRGVGVEHFLLYNHESEDNFMDTLLPYIEEGVVELFEWKDRKPNENFAYSLQPAAYRDALEKVKGKTAWIAFIDLDEYLVPMQGRDVRQVLRDHYTHAAAIYVSWLPFGTDGLHLGPGPILPFLTACAKRSQRECCIGKSIVRPEVVATVEEPHFSKLIAPFQYFNGDGEMKIDLNHHDKFLRLNHYMFRDEWYFWNTKVPRYLKWNGNVKDLKKLNKAFSKSRDYKILELLP